MILRNTKEQRKLRIAKGTKRLKETQSYIKRNNLDILPDPKFKGYYSFGVTL